jgi:predicted  nucleic acid-binding Zn-ribbon protein
MKITKGKGLAKFGGVMQQLMTGPKGGANREFIAFLESMDNKTRKTYMTIEKGQVVLTKQGKALKEAFNEKVIGEYQVTQAQTIQDTLAQRAALLRLKAAGVDNATALEMVADASLAVAINSKSITSEELVKMGKDAKKAKDEIKDLNLAVQNLGQSVKDKITNLNTVITALSAARASGITSEELLDYIASNQDLADQIANKGINDPIVQDLLKNQPKIEDLEGAIDGLKNPLAKIQSDFDKAREKAEKFYNFLENQANASYKKWLQDTKVTFEGVAYSIETALEKAEEKIAEYQEQIDDANRNVELQFDRPMEALKEQIDDIQRDIELQFDRPIEGLQREINGLQRQIEEQFDRPIEALQDESGRLSNDLSILDRAADVINKKYDAQEEALNKISELNQDIIAQEKQRISLADAITQGDISAAAQAAQDMRAAAAASAAQRAGGALGQAREAEIAGLRTAGGLTRAQIEERQFQISQQVYQLEQGRAVIQAQILAKQDAIYKLEQAKIPFLDKIRGIEDEIYRLQELKEAELLKIRDLEDEIYKINENTVEPINKQLDARQKILKAELDAIEAQRAKWEETQAAIDAAKLKADGFDTTMKGIESKTAAMLANWNSIESKVVELTIIEKRIIQYEEDPNKQDPTKDPTKTGNKGKLVPAMYGGKVKPMAYGGRVGSDFVPSLLTPGEFVVNKFAAKKFGPLLESINGSKYPSMMGGDMMAQPSYDISSPTSIAMPVKNTMSNINNNSNAVYNYSVGITVNGTNINPNSIARNVIDQIKYIDSQRIVGQRTR